MRRLVTILVMLVALVSMIAACAVPDDGVLRQIQPGATVYIDGWDESNDVDDQALVEEKPGEEGKPKLWVVPTNVPFRLQPSDGFTVKVILTYDGVFEVLDMGGTKVGKDHDNCLADGEHYAQMKVPANQLQWEGDSGDSGTPNDDCERFPDVE